MAVLNQKLLAKKDLSIIKNLKIFLFNFKIFFNNYII